MKKNIVIIMLSIFCLALMYYGYEQKKETEYQMEQAVEAVRQAKEASSQAQESRIQAEQARAEARVITLRAQEQLELAKYKSPQSQ